MEVSSQAERSSASCFSRSTTRRWRACSAAIMTPLASTMSMLRSSSPSPKAAAKSWAHSVLAVTVETAFVRDDQPHRVHLDPDIVRERENVMLTSTRPAEAENRPPTTRRKGEAGGVRRSAKVALAAVVVCATLFGAANAASASFSPYVSVYYKYFRAPANDCFAEAGAHFRTDRQVQGEGKVTCGLRHAQTVVSVRLLRWNGSAWVGLPWKVYTFNNSYGTGTAHIVTDTSRICGLAYWSTQVAATVTTNTTSNGVIVSNAAQQYDPCT